VDYLVPADETEQNLMIEKMMLAGLLESEDKSNIATKKAAYNKACKEFKKGENKRSKISKKTNKTRNHVNKILNEHGC
jgi:aminoglycoside phosphotransferase family enzyme